LRGLYLRTSTNKQDGDAQRAMLQRAAWSRSWLPTQVNVPQVATVNAELSPGVLWFEDDGISGKTSSRPAIDLVEELAQQGVLQELMVTEISRIGRDLVPVIRFIDAVSRAGCVIHVLTMGAPLDPRDPMGRMLINFNASYAELEHGMIVRRVREGQQLAQRRGVHIGRPRRDIPAEILQKARKLRDQGKSLRKIAMTVHVPLGTLRGRLDDPQLEISAVRKVPPRRARTRP
jgi:DNA invertase Pin-like site-specific DNA recombinase